MVYSWCVHFPSEGSGAAETAGTPCAFPEFIDDVEADLKYRDDDQLRQSVQRVQCESLVAAVPCRNHQLSLIIRVDQTDEVAQYDAVFVSQAAAWQDEGGVSRVGDMYGQTCRNQTGFSRFDD